MRTSRNQCPKHPQRRGGSRTPDHPLPAAESCGHPSAAGLFACGDGRVEADYIGPNHPERIWSLGEAFSQSRLATASLLLRSKSRSFSTCVTCCKFVVHDALGFDASMIWLFWGSGTSALHPGLETNMHRLLARDHHLRY